MYVDAMAISDESSKQQKAESRKSGLCQISCKGRLGGEETGRPRGSIKLTRAVHIDEHIGIPRPLGILAAHNHGLGPQPLRLPDLLDELALAALDERNPCLGRMAWAAQAELGAPVVRAGV